MSLPSADSTPRAAAPPGLSTPRQRSHSAATTIVNNLASGSPNNSSNQNSNNTIPVNYQMERVTFNLFSRLCDFGLTHTSYRTRKIAENLLLVVAICCGGALLMLHRTFVTTQSPAMNYSINAAASMTKAAAAIPLLPATCLDRLEGFDPGIADLTHLVILPHNLTLQNEEGETMVESKSMVLWDKKQRSSNQLSECTMNLEDPINAVDADTCKSSKSAVNPIEVGNLQHQNHRKWLDQHLASNTLPIKYSYSTTKAYVMLPYDHSWLRQDLDVQYVLVAPTDPVCFGEPFVQFLLWNCFIGGNTVLLNWLRTFPAYQDTALDESDSKPLSRGFIYNPRTEWMKEVNRKSAVATARKGYGSSDQNTDTTWSTLRSKWKKLLGKVGVFLRTSFLFFFCTTLVSFTLRETQERMLNFTRELSRRVRQSISLSDLITNHLVQNLVFVPIMLGMMFFLIEFYHGDKFLAFSITSIVWSVEGFSLVCLRSSQGLQYFPYFFFLLFLLFHVYQSAFEDHGFVYLALTVVWCFMLHSMVFFWHRFELPALVLGNVSVHRPRMNHSAYVYSEEEYDQDPGAGIGGYHDTINATNEDTSRSQQQQDEQGSGSSSSHPAQASASIEGNHLTAPLIRNATAAGRNSSSSLLSSNTGGGGTGFLASRPSFQSTTSSRRTAGLYRLNQEDDSSTGSHLYFMGGEVVLHQPRPILVNQNNGGNNSHGSRDLLHPLSRIGNSSENIAASGPIASATGAHGEGEESVEPPISSFVRNESNYSLLSITSDPHNFGSSNHASNSNPEIGLDVTGCWSGGPREGVIATNVQERFLETLPNDTSMDTAEASIVMSPQSQRQTRENNNSNGNGGDKASDGCYDQEVGGLQAIFNTKKTPRHRNTFHQSSIEGCPQQLNAPSNGIHYQRSPPNLTELNQQS